MAGFERSRLPRLQGGTKMACPHMRYWNACIHFALRLAQGDEDRGQLGVRPA